jgi:tRNA A37 threonylcarbamoyladenosine synthetase subunit TsaC/SUA5/YrdC
LEKVVKTILGSKTLSWPIHGQEAWDNQVRVKAAADALSKGGRAIVTPTKVGYIVMTTDEGGLAKKFDMKQRPLSKPGVVLCDDSEHAATLALMDDRIRELYRRAYGSRADAQDRGTLLGCILPWQDEPSRIMNGVRPYIMDARGTSCFVIRYGTPSEAIAHWMLKEYGKLCFASSANPSGKGNRGVLAGVGDRILEMADFIIEGDEFVASQQPNATDGNRWEQGAMVSFVDEAGALSYDKPKIIRNGIQLEAVKNLLTDIFGGYVEAHGDYH